MVIGAGGDIAMRVQSDMVKFYLAMRAAGQATFINAAFHFLRTYNFIFRRLVDANISKDAKLVDDALEISEQSEI